ncbi:MAG: diguanylate cyclase/phosphodiesterase [Alphaproteobacteria bacterium]|jgi:EAL domain-containing protein (putative c-di-GMP-specific phosphodiesterase class I)|nr:diguanylate cyclase/phosphodiesterase [Alphaproteobacteria bacterium]
MTINELSRSFSASINDVLDYATRFQKPYGFIVVVLDHMNEDQNDIANMTSQLYPTLKKNVRVTDTVFRFSQDAWIIWLDDCDDRLLQWTLYTLQSVLHRRDTQIPNHLQDTLMVVRGSCSPTNTLNQTIKAFEHEIQLAKDSLRRLKMMHLTALGSINALSDNPAYSASFIHQTILDNRLFLAFQPVVDSTSRQLGYYECLARILDHNGQILPAGAFISQCEKTGLIPLIDQKVQQLAIEELMNDRHLQLAINVSAITAIDPQWLRTLKVQLTARPDLQGRLMIELTETSVFQNIDESIEFITQLRDLGCPVSIDDFGAGYMSLTHLKSDLVQTVKIDAQFVKDLKPGSHNIPFIRAIKALTQHQGIKCVAEGVEDAQTLAILAQEHIDYLQGYYIDKPSHFRGWT